MRNKFITLIITVLMGAAFNLQAASSVDCSKKTLAKELDKLNKSDPNEVTISGTCNEDILIQGFSNLTLIGQAGAEIAGTNPLAIEGSKVRVESLTLNATDTGARCDKRSVCTFEDISIVCGSGSGILAQTQSAVDIQGTGTISGCGFAGIGVFGASSVNVGPTDTGTFDPEAPALVISSSGVAGAFVADGSFFRSDNVSYVGNLFGVWAFRNATVKVFDIRSTPVGIDGSTLSGMILLSGTSAQVGLPITNSTGPAIELGALSWVQPAFGFSLSGNAPDGVICQHPTAVPGGGLACEP